MSPSILVLVWKEKYKNMCSICISCVIIRVRNFGGGKMQKGKFKYQLKSKDVLNEYEGICSYSQDDILTFCEPDNTKVLIDLENSILKRENDEMLLTLNFLKNEGIIFVKELDRKIDLQMKVNSKKIEKNRLIINYTLSNQDEFEFFIEWFLGGE